MRKLILTVALLMSLTLISGCGTSTENYAPYLNDNKNAPLTWTHKNAAKYSLLDTGKVINEAEYALLDTCKVIRDDNDSYEISIEYFYCSQDEEGNGVGFGSKRIFRQNKDGKSLPQYSEDNGNTWITIPSWKDKDAVERMQDPNMCGHYPNFAFHYNPRAYYLFCAAYKQAFGKDYVDI